MADAQRLLEKYQAGASDSSAADVHAQILEMQKPTWSKYQATKQFEMTLGQLQTGTGKASFNQETIEACMAVMSIKDDAAPLQYILTVLYDALREDGSCYGMVEEAVKKNVDVFKPLMGVLERQSSDANQAYIADKGAWLLTAIIGHMPRHFSEQQVQSVMKLLLARGHSCSDLGVLEAITNLLKSQQFRNTVWMEKGVQNLIFRFEPKTTPSPQLYKSVFAIWMASFDASLAQSLKENNIVSKIKAVLAFSRTEKVIRLCLTVLKNFLAQKADGAAKAICEDIVEQGVLEAVQQLEYEKWRDSELYDDIRELVQLINSEVKELSNFDRYMKELESGTLSWGFIHSAKFFGENVMKFENNEFKAVKELAKLLSSSNTETLAVACHDIGEFVSLHPLGKKQVARLGVKDRIMELMSSQDGDKREVRREALLCCQKIMLNKWQDVATTAEKK